MENLMPANRAKPTPKNSDQPQSASRKNNGAKLPAGKIFAGRNGGRKENAEYRPEFAERAKLLCAKGATKLDLADYFGVPLSTITEWRAFQEEFDIACKVDRDVLMARVEESLVESAIGGTRMTEDFRVVRGELVKVRYRKHTPGNIDAQKFLLTNRKPNEWSTHPEPKPTENPLARLYDAICGTKLMPNDDQTGYLEGGDEYIDAYWREVDDMQPKKALPGIPKKDPT
jgi:hypothetical protein